MGDVINLESYQVSQRILLRYVGEEEELRIPLKNY